jgi:PAS domain S-box-containing protein
LREQFSFLEIFATRAERELVAAERRARTILESISDTFMLLDPEWRLAQLNPAAERIMGSPAAPFIGRNVWDVRPAIIGLSVEEAYRKAVAEGVPVHFENHYEPWDRWYDVSAYPSSEGLAVYFRDITDRKRGEAALQRLNEDLRQFTYAATHDLRDPLRMITIYAQLLQRKLGSEVDQQANDYLANIVSSAQRVIRLVDGLLNFTRAGESESAEPKPVDSEAALKEALDNLQLAIAESKAEIAYDPLPTVLGDLTYISQLFQNLIANALKYHVPGTAPKIHLSAKHDGTQQIFAVRDNGIGIAPEDQETIFIPFKRLHGSEIAGVGIGLPTCKRIVERYRGRIWIESKLGEGSTFYFSLPAKEVASVE